VKQQISAILAATGLLLSPSGFAGSASEGDLPVTVLPFPFQVSPLQPQCWLDHTQLQPVPSRRWKVEGSLAGGGPKVWNQPGSRPGSEHWNVADLQRACQPQWARSTAASSAVGDFLDSR
jgi:hypothetical protein